MKKILTIILLFVFGLSFAQTPQIINYQGVARDASGEAIPNTTLSIRFEILQGSGSTAVFTETTSVVTNQLGLFTTQIGLSNPTAIGSINFANGGLSLRIGIDVNGGSSFVNLGTQSLTSVPYSMYAADVPATYTNNILTIGKSNFTLNTGATAVYTASTGISIVSNSIILNTLPDQTVSIDPGNSNINVTGTYPNFTVASTPSLTINGSSLSISDGNTVVIPSAASPTLTPQGVITVTSGVNSFTIGAPAQVAQTITPQGAVTLTSGVNSFTIGAPAQVAQTITPQGAVTVTTGVNSFTIGAPAATPPTITPQGALSLTTGVNSYTISAPAQVTQTITPQGAITLTTGVNSFTIGTAAPATQSLVVLAPGTLSITGSNSVSLLPSLSLVGSTLTSGPVTNSVILPTTSIVPSGVVNLSQVGNNYTINVPQTTMSPTGGGVTITSPSTNSFVVDVPATTLTPGTNVTINGAHPAYTINAAPTLTLVGNNLSISGGNTIAIPSNTIVALTTTLQTGGIAQLTTFGPNDYSVHVPNPTLSISGSSLSINGGNTVIIPSAAAQTLVPQGAITVTSGANSFTIGAPAQVAQTITPQGAVTVTTGVNSFTIGAPSSAAQTIVPQGAVTVTSGVNSFTVGAPAQVAQTIVPQGAVTVTSGVNSFTIGAPSSAAQTIIPQGAVTVTSGVNSFTVSAPAQVAQTIVPQGAVTLTTGVNSFTIGAPAAAAQTIVPQGAVTVTNGVNSFTVSAPAQVAQTIVPQGAVTLTTGVNSFTIGAPAAAAQTIIPQGIVNVTTGVNSFTVGAPAQTIVPQGAVTVTNGANSFTVSAPAQVTQTLVPQGAVTVTTGVNSFTIGAPAATAQTIIPQGIVTVTSGVNSFTVGAAAQTIVPQGAVTVTNGANSFTVSAPAQVTQTLVPQGAVTVTTGVNSFTIGAPAAAAQTIIPQGIVNVTTGVNSFTVGAPAQTIVPQGAVTVTNGANSFTVNAPAQVAQTIVPQGAVTVTNGTNSFTINVPNAVTPTILPLGILTQTAVGNNFTLNVPPPTYTASTGALFMGTSSVNITPTLSLSGNVLTVGPSLNQVILPATPSVFAAGIATVSPGPNYTVGVPAPSITPSGILTRTTSGNSFTLHVPAQTITPQGAVTLTTGVNSFTIGAPAAAAQTLVPQGAVTITSGVNSYTIGTPAQVTQTLVPQGAVTVTTGVNSFTVSAPAQVAQTIVPQGAVTVTNGTNSFTINVPNAVTPTILPLGILTQTAVGNNFTLNVPPPTYTASTGALFMGTSSVNITPTLSLSGNVLTVGPSLNQVILPATPSVFAAGIATVSPGPNYTVGVPAPSITPSGILTRTTSGNSFTLHVPAQSITPQGAVTLTTGVNSFTIGAPAATAQTIIPQGIVTVTSGVNSFTVGAPAQTLVPQGAVTVTTGVNSFTVSAPAQVAQTIVPQGAVTVTNGTNSFTINVPNAVTPTILPLGILTQTAVGSSFTLNVPPPTYTASTGALFMGTSSVNITPTLSLSGNVLTVGPSLNQVILPTTPSVFAAGIATVSPGPNYTVGVPAPSITPSGILTRTVSGNSFTLNVPAPSYTAATGALGMGSASVNITPLASMAGTVLTIGPASNTVGIPFTQTTSIIGTGAAIVTSNTAANYTINVPFTAITQSTGILVSGTSPNYTITSTPTLVLAGSNLSLVGGNTVVLPTTPTVSAAGILTVSPGPNYSVGLPAATFTPATGILQIGSGTVITTPSLSLSGNVLTVGPSTNQVTLPTPTIFAAGIATVNPVGPSFTVGVPLPTYTAATGALGMGTASVNITQALSLSGTTLTSGPASNSINLANGTTALWSTLGNSNTIPATNFLGTTDNNALVFRTNNIERARITQAGRFAIGTNSPGHDLTVETGSNTSLALVANTASVALINFGTTVDNSKGSIRYDNTSNAMNFWTNSVNTRMVINSTGNVGIGTAAPTQNLTVLNGMNIDAADANTGSFTNGLSFGTTSGEGIASKRTAGVNQFGLNFYTNTTNRMTITQGGNVGIGTISPLVRFEVAPNSIVTTTAQGQSTFYQNGNVGGALMAESNSNGNNSGGSLYARAYIASYQTSPIVALNGDLGVNAYGNTWGGVFSGGNGFATPNTYVGLGGLTYAGVFMGGNVGVGNVAPTERLDVTGNLKFSGDLRPNNLPGASGEILQSAGSGLPPIWVTSGLVAGGTTNYIPKWNSATALSSTSQLYDNGTFVGVGTAAPDAKLTVEGTIDMGTNNLVTGFASGAIGSSHAVPGHRSYAFGTNGSVGHIGSMVFGDWSGGTIISSTNNDQLSARFENGYRFFTDGVLNPSAGIFFSAVGNVGIGTANPNLYSGTGKYLSVSSTSVYSANSPAVVELQGSSTSPAVAVARLDFNSLFTAGSPTNTARIALMRGGGSSTEGELAFSTHNGTSLTEAMRISKDGYVGIGTTSPSRLFEVSPGTNPAGLNVGQSTFFHNSGDGNAIFAESNSSGNSGGSATSYARAILAGINSNGPGGYVNAGVWGAVTGLGARGYGVLASAGALGTYSTWVGLATSSIAATFNGGNVGIETTNPIYKLSVHGASSNAFTGPNLSFVTSQDIYPTTYLLNWSHGEQWLLFNGYYEPGTFRSSSTSGNHAITNQNGTLQFRAAAGFAAGASIGWTNALAIDNTGQVGIGTTAPAYQLQLSTNSAAKPTGGSWAVPSDSRLKKDVRPYEGGLSDIMKIKPVWFTYTGEAGMPKETGVGIIAQELQQVAPYMVHEWTYEPPAVNTEGATTNEVSKDAGGEKKNYLGVDNSAMTYMIINAIKEQQQQIEDLKKVVAEQQKQIDQLLKK